MKNQNFKPGTIWIIGLSASGKTTLGNILFENLKNRGFDKVDFFDGEAVRESLGDIRGYTVEDRNALNIHKARLASQSNLKGRIAIVTGISHKRDMRQEIRNNLKHFMEVYLKCPVEVCAKRDRKGHYQKAFRGEYNNFIGVTHQYEESENAELILKTDLISIEVCSSLLLKKALEFLFSL